MDISHVKEVGDYMNQWFVPYGGGDLPEDLQGGLERVMSQLSWPKGNTPKFLIVISDGPAHGAHFHDRSVHDDLRGKSDAQLLSEMTQTLTRLRDEYKIRLTYASMRRSLTSATENKLREIYDNNRENIDMTTIDMFGGAQREPPVFHYVFVLDQSGSMSGDPWSQVVNAVRDFRNRRNGDQLDEDYASVVLFDDSVQVPCEFQRLSSVGDLGGNRGGGTNFLPALEMAADIVRRHRHAENGQPLVTHVLFLSDGQDGSGSNAYVDQVRQMRAEFGASFAVHAIAYGAGASVASLSEISQAGGTGNAKIADLNTITKVFGQIADDSGKKAMEGLTNKFGELVSELVATKLTLNYL
jgi:Mg-chelatase subunit ChlD